MLNSLFLYPQPRGEFSLKNTFASKEEKITDKAFSQGLFISVFSILLCIVALCSTTYAWFSNDVSSNSNRLVTGNFDLTVSVTKSANGTAIADSENPIKVTKDSSGVSSCTLTNAGEYIVTLTMSEDTTVSKGFCIIEINGKSYSTVSINKTDRTEPFVFKISVHESDALIYFTSVWGLPSHEDVQMNGELTIESAQRE